MKLTVSNTVMMKPLLHTVRQPLRTSPPQRVVGLLELSQVQLSQHDKTLKGLQKLAQYNGTNQQYELQQTAEWEDFLQLDNVKKIPCVAVFDFKFDGTNTWYQVWSRTNDQTRWLLHNNSMNYQAYAILTMDALVSVIPNWDGTLYQSPDTPNNPHIADKKPEIVDANQINNLLVTDASTSTAGQLWFRVTINPRQMEIGTESKIIPTRSGWISPSIPI